MSDNALLDDDRSPSQKLLSKQLSSIHKLSNYQGYNEISSEIQNLNESTKAQLE